MAYIGNPASRPSLSGCNSSLSRGYASTKSSFFEKQALLFQRLRHIKTIEFSYFCKVVITFRIHSQARQQHFDLILVLFNVCTGFPAFSSDHSGYKQQTAQHAYAIRDS